MSTITVIKPFTFTFDDHSQFDFTPGDWDVPDYVANNSFVQAHTPHPPEQLATHVIGTRKHHPLVKPAGAKNTNEPFAPNPSLEPAPKVDDAPYAGRGNVTPPPSPIGASGGPTEGSKDTRQLSVKERERAEENSGFEKKEDSKEDGKKK